MHYIDGKGHKPELRCNSLFNQSYGSPNHATSYLWPGGGHTLTHTRKYLHESYFKKPGVHQLQADVHLVLQQCKSIPNLYCVLSY